MEKFTREDLAVFFASCFLNVAKAIGLTEDPFKSQIELMDDIDDNNRIVGGCLRDFLKAYRKWYDYSYDEEGNSKKDYDKEIYVKYMNARDEKRERLKKSLN